MGCGTRSGGDQRTDPGHHKLENANGATPLPRRLRLVPHPSHPPCWGSTQVGVERERKPKLGGFTDLALGPCACLPSRIQNLRMMLGVPPQPVRVHIAKPKAPAPVTSSEFSHPHYRHQPRIRIIFPVSSAATQPLDQSPTRQIKGWKLESRLATSGNSFVPLSLERSSCLLPASSMDCKITLGVAARQNKAPN